MSEQLLCWNCGTSIEDVPRPISRHANCSQCFEVLHCCRLCRHYAPGRPDDCDEDRAEPPTNKENANFCEYFKPCSTAFKTGNRIPQSLATEKFDALFDDELFDDESFDDESFDDDAKKAERDQFDSEKSAATHTKESTNLFDDLFND